MNVSKDLQGTVDYAGFDFAGLWRGRDRVTEVEQAILAQFLTAADRRRVLEVGTGFGRLLAPLASASREVVATDLDVSNLLRASPGSDNVTRVASNLYRLPFADQSFTATTLIRVHHHLLDPVGALRELGRVLRPGSLALVSYRPAPTIGTLVDDIQRALRRTDSGRFVSTTFSRRPLVLPPEPFPIRAVGRRQFATEASDAKFRAARETGAGFEEYAPLRVFTSGSFVRFGTALARAPAFPTRFVELRSAGTPSRRDLGELSQVLVCPACRSPQPDWFTADEPRCGQCGFQGGRRGSVIDLRYLPEGAPQWRAPQ